jgi:signal transduction histidine kinase
VEIATEELLGTATPPDSEESRGFIADIAQALESDACTYERAVAMGVAWHVGGGDLVGLAREVARLGRRVADGLEEQGASSPAERRRAREVIDEASARTLEAFGSATRTRRDRWLSYYSHEMRNALNTLVNAHWILKNSEGKNQTRVFDMVERAVRRLEASVKEVRDLDTQTQQPAPGRPDRT